MGIPEIAQGLFDDYWLDVVLFFAQRVNLVLVCAGLCCWYLLCGVRLLSIHLPRSCWYVLVNARESALIPYSVTHLCRIFGQWHCTCCWQKSWQLTTAHVTICFWSPVEVLPRTGVEDAEEQQRARVSRSSRIQSDLADPRAQTQFVANSRSQRRCTTCYRFTVATWTQSHEQRRRRDRTHEHGTQQEQERATCCKRSDTKTSGIRSADSATIWRVSFENYPTTS